MRNNSNVVPQEFLWCIPKIYKRSSDIILEKEFAFRYDFWRILFRIIF